MPNSACSDRRLKINKHTTRLVLLTRALSASQWSCDAQSSRLVIPSSQMRKWRPRGREVAYLMSHTEKWHCPDSVSQSVSKCCNRLTGTANAQPCINTHRQPLSLQGRMGVGRGGRSGDLDPHSSRARVTAVFLFFFFPFPR